MLWVVQYAMQHLLTIFRTATARGKAEQSDIASMHAREDAQVAKECSTEYGATSNLVTSNEIDGATSNAPAPSKIHLTVDKPAYSHTSR